MQHDMFYLAFLNNEVLCSCDIDGNIFYIPPTYGDFRSSGILLQTLNAHVSSVCVESSGGVPQGFVLGPFSFLRFLPFSFCV